MIRLILLISIFYFSKVSATDYVGKDLLNYFSSTCPSQGDWTKLVTSDAEAIISILEQLKNDPDCKSAAGSIAQLKGLSSRISELQISSKTKIEIEKLKAKEIELSNQIGHVSDPLVVTEIQAAMRAVQIEKAALLAEVSSREGLAGESIGETYSQIVLSTNQLYKSISNSPRCLDKNPRVMSTVTSIVSSIGGGLTAVNPALGIGLSAVSELLGNTVEAIRIGKINRKIRKVSDGTLINSGFKCAMEALSNRWCELTDARKLLDFKFNLNKQSDPNLGYLSVVNLYDRKIPSFLDWLAKVRTGATAATESDAKRHAIVYERWKIVQVASSKGDGILTEFKSTYDDSGSDNEKYTIIKQVINKLISQSGVYLLDGMTNPLTDIYSVEAPFRLLGLDKIPKTEFGNYIDFELFNPFLDLPTGQYAPSYEKVEVAYKTWIDKATRLVNKEFTRVLQPDALGVLSTAFERSGSKWKVSPKESIDDLRKFLAENRPSFFETSAFKKIYEDTEFRLQTISNALIDTLVLQTQTPAKAIELIFNSADLQFGTIVFKSRLDMTVRISLDEYFKISLPEEQNIAAQMLSMESYLETLRKVSGKDSDELVMLDIQNAQKGALSNMRNFVEVFAKNINQLLKNNNKKILNPKDDFQKSIDAEDQARICVLLSSMPEISKKIDISLCNGKQMTALMKGGPETEIISDKYLQQSFSQRNCAYRDYIRKSKIYREWGIKL